MMNKNLNLIPYGIQKIDEKMLKKIQGGIIIAAVALGVGMMALAYQVGKDFARYTKNLENR
jgi:xanthine/uracil permease